MRVVGRLLVVCHTLLVAAIAAVIVVRLVVITRWNRYVVRLLLH